MKSLQDTYAPNLKCFGCGPSNDKGLRIKSFPEGEKVVAHFRPEAHHQAFENMLSGGICGCLLDCHSNWAASHYFMQRRHADSPPPTVTAEYAIKLLKPTPMDCELRLEAHLVEISDRKAIVESCILANGDATATCRGVFIAVKEDHPAFHRW